MIVSREEKGPASVGALPDRGSHHIPVEDTKMNEVTNTTPDIMTASGALDPDMVRDAVESLWSDILNLQRKAYLLMGDLEDCLRPERGKVDGSNVTLMFQKIGIDVTQWLAGEVWADSDKIVNRSEDLLAQLERACK